jgi:hypothetical protein
MTSYPCTSGCCDLPLLICEMDTTAIQQFRMTLLAKGWFASLYRGVCLECHEPFGQGVMIKSAGGYGRRRYVAECCADVEML